MLVRTTKTKRTKIELRAILKGKNTEGERETVIQKKSLSST